MEDDIQLQGFRSEQTVRVEGEPMTSMALVANVWVKQMFFQNVGDSNPGHKHLFDHSTLLATGGVQVNIGGVVSEFKAPRIIWVKAGVEHTFTATRPNTVCYCIHAIRDGDGVDDIIDPESVPAGARGLGSIPGAKPLIEQ